MNEIDLIIARRTDDQNDIGNEDRKQLMFYLDLFEGLLKEPNILVIVTSNATNPKKTLDDAFIRSGRVKSFLEVPLPDEQKVNLILKKEIKEEEIKIEIENNLFYKLLVKQLHKRKQSSADIVAFVRYYKDDIKKSNENLLKTNNTDEVEIEKTINILLDSCLCL
jgi:ATP-dependent 26S proteasome regulatory subunit